MLSFALLGPARIALAHQPLGELVYSKAQSLLTYLAVEQGRQFDRAELASFFWPEAAHEVALGNLRYTLHRLRKALGDTHRPAEPYLLTTAARIGFNPASHHRLDVLELSAGVARAELILRHDAPPDTLATLASIAGLYRGEFLAGLPIDPATQLGHWVQNQRRAQAHSACTLLSKLSRAHEQRAELAQAIRFARQQAQVDPCDEEVQRRIILLLALSGERQAALAHYDFFNSYLSHELATSPEKETRQLVEHIRTMCRPAAITLCGADAPIERRCITVLYCCISAAAIRERQSPGLKLQARLLAVQQHCQRILLDHGGHLIQLPGGYLLAYFGFPVAQEESAARALRASLALASLRTEEFHVQCGVHSGLAVSGRGG